MPTHQLFRAIGTIALAFGLVFPTQAQDFDPIGDEPLYPWENVAEPTLAELDNDVDTAS